jgi:hypothetical protein
MLQKSPMLEKIADSIEKKIVATLKKPWRRIRRNIRSSSPSMASI